jgi:hypothetical protein
MQSAAQYNQNRKKYKKLKVFDQRRNPAKIEEFLLTFFINFFLIQIIFRIKSLRNSIVFSRVLQSLK